MKEEVLSANSDERMPNAVLYWGNRIRQYVAPVGISSGVLLATAKTFGLIQISNRAYMTWFFYRLGMTSIVGFFSIASILLVLSRISKGKDVYRIEDLARNNPAKSSAENVTIGLYVVVVEISALLCFAFAANLLSLLLSGNFLQTVRGM